MFFSTPAGGYGPDRLLAVGVDQTASRRQPLIPGHYPMLSMPDALAALIATG